jgi:hypothetical protein
MARVTRMDGPDPELAAINTILKALDGLEGESIQRVLDYVVGRLSIGRLGAAISPVASAGTNASHVPSGSPSSATQLSIKDLREQKNPTAANQMAALVAYYLSEIAPESERKDSINSADLEKYFKQARFRLPKSVSQALPNAAQAGYFDSVGHGRYRLNPVGYNLVAHGLPRASDAPEKGGLTRRK